jgi:uncharacterized membrane protein YdbT with pleckstrin-like domain
MEEKIWESSPSQWTNFNVFLFLGWTIVVPIWYFLVTKCTKFSLTNQRLTIGEGVLSKTYNELELYRVKDIKENASFVQRILGYGNVTLTTSDASNPVVVLNWISEPTNVRNTIRSIVEARREARGVKEYDVR